MRFLPLALLYSLCRVRDRARRRGEKVAWSGSRSVRLRAFSGRGGVSASHFFRRLARTIAKDADLRLYYNTDTIGVGLDRLSFGKNFDFSIALRGEVIFAGLLRYYYVGAVRQSQFGINASYVVLLPKVQWHFADNHTFELLTNVRRWFFGSDDTDPTYLLPADSWVFEPRLRVHLLERELAFG